MNEIKGFSGVVSVNLEIAKFLQHTANLLNRKGEVKRAIAFTQAAFSVKEYPIDISKLGGYIKGIKYVGKHIADDICEYITRGTSARVQALELKFDDDSDSLKFPYPLCKSSDKLPRRWMEETGNKIISILKPVSDQIEYVGSIQRKCDLVSNIDILVLTNKKVTELKVLLKKAGYEIRYTGVNKVKLLVNINRFKKECNIYITSDWESDFNRLVSKQVSNVPVELRDLDIEVIDKIMTEIPQGDIHIHSQFSGAENYIFQIIDQATVLGFSYIGISDLLNSLYKMIYSYSSIIDSFNKNHSCNISIYKGIEIKIDNQNQYLDQFLSIPDYIILSVSNEYRDNNLVTQYINYINRLDRFPLIIGHLTGQYFGYRQFSNDENWDRLFDICSSKNVLIEINTAPVRLDPPIDLLKKAKDHGCKFIVGSDTYEGLSNGFIMDGYYKARKALLTNEDVITNNEQIKKWMEGVKNGRT